MTPNFAEQAERYATGNHRVSFPDTVEMKAFLAGCEHGYRVGKDEFKEVRRECGHPSYAGFGSYCELCKSDQLRQQLAERDAQLEDRMKWTKVYQTNVENLHACVEELRTRIEDAEKALKEIKVMSVSSEAEQRRNGIFRDWKDIARAYFTKHPQDGAKGDL